MIENSRVRPVLDRLVRMGYAHPRTAKLARLLVGNRKEVVRFIKFAIVGASGTIVDFSTLNFVHLALGLSLVVSNSISFCVAVVSNFTWNRLWTFPESRQRPLGTQLAQFAAVNIVGLGINQAVFLSLNHYVFEPLVGGLGYNLAKMVAIIVVLFWNFSINRIWTYKGIQ